MKVIVNDNQRGFLIKNGKFVKLLGSGKYNIFGNSTIELAELDKAVFSQTIPLEKLLADEDIKAQTDTIQVGDGQIALHFVNGKYRTVLTRGKHSFWNVYDKNEFKIIDMTSPYVSKDIPEYMFKMIPPVFYTKIEVAEYQKALLFLNNKFERLLDAGTYYFWKTETKIDVHCSDTRLLKMDITGQEILTKDKVAVRINFVCTYKITDHIKIKTDIDDYKEQIHTAVQLALREYVGKYRIDEILDNKEEMSQIIYEKLKSKEKLFYVEFFETGIKDIILPGEIRNIMNEVLVAEKRAQANVITRREEVASTRSLLNTAKLMEENKTLYHLKEMEYIERICHNVGDISINGNGNLMGQLTEILRGTPVK